jgi:O-antigen ligase
MMSGGVWKLTWGDVLLLIGIVVLFIEIVKATYTGTASMIDHGLSMVVFIAFLVEFLMVSQAASSVFFLLMMTALIDVIAGFTIGIRVAKRDIGFGGVDH